MKAYPDIVYLLFINFEYLETSSLKSEDSLEKFRNGQKSMVLNIFELKIIGQAHFLLETLDFRLLTSLKCSRLPIYLFILNRELQLEVMEDDTIL